MTIFCLFYLVILVGYINFHLFTVDNDEHASLGAENDSVEDGRGGRSLVKHHVRGSRLVHGIGAWPASYSHFPVREKYWTSRLSTTGA